MDGEKVLYIRGEVSYNTARYWFELAGASGLRMGEGRREAVLFLLAELPAAAGAKKRGCGSGGEGKEILVWAI